MEEVRITPTTISRVVPGGPAQVASIPGPNGKALLVFGSPAEAETFRSETGRFPEAEGFRITPADHDDVETLCAFAGLDQVALRGPEPDTVSFFEAGVFVGILKESIGAGLGGEA